MYQLEKQEKRSGFYDEIKQYVEVKWYELKS